MDLLDYVHSWLVAHCSTVKTIQYDILPDTLRAGKHELYSLSTILLKTPDPVKTAQKETNKLSELLAEAREEQARKLGEEGLMNKAEAEETRPHSVTLERSVQDTNRRDTEEEASFAKHFRTVREKASVQCLQMERSMREGYGPRV